MSSNDEKRQPDLDDLMAAGMPLWKALEVWVANRHRAFQEDLQDERCSDLSGLTGKPHTRLQ